MKRAINNTIEQMRPHGARGFSRNPSTHETAITGISAIKKAGSV